jgi:hypothetical protein
MAFSGLLFSMYNGEVEKTHPKFVQAFSGYAFVHVQLVDGKEAAKNGSLQ